MQGSWHGLPQGPKPNLEANPKWNVPQCFWWQHPHQSKGTASLGAERRGRDYVRRGMGLQQVLKCRILPATSLSSSKILALAQCMPPARIFPPGCTLPAFQCQKFSTTICPSTHHLNSAMYRNLYSQHPNQYAEAVSWSTSPSETLAGWLDIDGDWLLLDDTIQWSQRIFYWTDW